MDDKGQSVPDDDYIYRVIGPSRWDYDENRPTSQAFSDNENGLSIFIGSGHSDQEVMRFYQDRGFTIKAIAKLKVSYCRSLELDIVTDPVPGNPSHGLLRPHGKISISGGTRKKLAKTCNNIFPEEFDQA